MKVPNRPSYEVGWGLCVLFSWRPGQAVDANMNTEYLSPNQLHLRWSLHPESIRRIVRKGKIPAIKIGKRLRISLAEVEAYEAANLINQRKEIASHV